MYEMKFRLVIILFLRLSATKDKTKAKEGLVAAHRGNIATGC